MIDGTFAGGRAASAPLMGHESEPTLFEMSVPGRRAYQLRTTGVPSVPLAQMIPASHLNDEVVDIADGAALQTFVRSAGEKLGGVDVLVSNASALVQGNAEADWQAMFDIDMLGAVRTWEAAQPFLNAAAAKSGDAAFLIISSVSSVNSDSPGAYGAMKAALIHFAKGVARQNAAAKVRCNVISPGTVYFDDGVWGRVKVGMPGFFDQMIKRNPTGRMATPEEIAAATVFLASPRSAFTTGINMIVDGAITQRVNY